MKRIHPRPGKEAPMKTDILHTLQAVLLENTTSYQSDFEFDVTTLLESADKPKIEDRTYYWLSRPCGTWCLKERDVFLKGSAAYNIWTHYESEHDGFRASRVVIEEKNDQGLFGQVIPFNYGESVQRIKKAALPYLYISGEFGGGTTFSKTLYTEFASNDYLRVRVHHGGLKRCEPYPENEDALKLRITQGDKLQAKRQTPEKGKRKCDSR